MNAVVHANPTDPARTIGSGQKLLWLLRREYWEHRGSFLWAPLIAGAISLLFFILAAGSGQWMLGKLKQDPANVTIINGQSISSSELDIRTWLKHASPEDLQELGQLVPGLTAMSSFWPLVVFAVVVFFYLLGALHDERRDRSILFWKSMPLSDGLTVLSKLLTALVVAPLIASLVCIAVMLAFGLIVSVFIAINGGNPFTLYWANLRPDVVFGGQLVWIPIYALWALPTAGWLLLCSAWARSKPFLWAVILPLLIGILISWFGLFGVEPRAFWEHVVARILTSALPYSHMFDAFVRPEIPLEDAQHWLTQSLPLSAGRGVITRPSLWIGVLAGSAMILLAVRLRRWRDDA
ncbi:hypothetical protein [Luteimonas sp. e5]